MKEWARAPGLGQVGQGAQFPDFADGAAGPGFLYFPILTRLRTQRTNGAKAHR